MCGLTVYHVMRAIRSVLFWVHLVAGVVAGAIVLIMSATGVALSVLLAIVGLASPRRETSFTRR